MWTRGTGNLWWWCQSSSDQQPLCSWPNREQRTTEAKPINTTIMTIYTLPHNYRHMFSPQCSGSPAKDHLSRWTEASQSLQRIQQRKGVRLIKFQKDGDLKIKKCRAQSLQTFPCKHLTLWRLNTICEPDLQTKPNLKPKLMQEAGKYRESAETELETRDHRKSHDECTGLADGDLHWGRLWPTAGGNTESYVSIHAPAFINNLTCMHKYTHDANIVLLMQVFLPNTHHLVIVLRKHV